MDEDLRAIFKQTMNLAELLCFTFEITEEQLHEAIESDPYVRQEISKMLLGWKNNLDKAIQSWKRVRGQK